MRGDAQIADTTRNGCFDRAITRAHMLVLVVDEVQPNGMLSFVQRLRFTDEYDRATERERLGEEELAEQRGEVRLLRPLPWRRRGPRAHLHHLAALLRLPVLLLRALLAAARRLAVSKQPQVPLAARPLKNLDIEV